MVHYEIASSEYSIPRVGKFSGKANKNWPKINKYKVTYFLHFRLDRRKVFIQDTRIIGRVQQKTIRYEIKSFLGKYTRVKKALVNKII